MIKDVFYKIMESDSEREKLNSLRDQAEIYDLFCKNGYGKTFDDFKVEVSSFLKSADSLKILNGNFKELSDDMLELVAGGFGIKRAVIGGVAALMATFTTAGVVGTVLNNSSRAEQTTISSSSEPGSFGGFSHKNEEKNEEKNENKDGNEKKNEKKSRVDRRLRSVKNGFKKVTPKIMRVKSVDNKKAAELAKGPNGSGGPAVRRTIVTNQNNNGNNNLNGNNINNTNNTNNPDNRPIKGADINENFTGTDYYESVDDHGSGELTNIRAIERRIKSETENLGKCEKGIQDIGKEIEKQNKIIRRLENNIPDLENRIENLKDRYKNLPEEQKEDRIQTTELKKEESKLRQELVIAKKTINESKKTIDELNNSLKKEEEIKKEIEEKIEKYKKSKIETEKNMEKYDQDKKTIEKESADRVEEINRKNKERSDHIKNIKENAKSKIKDKVNKKMKYNTDTVLSFIDKETGGKVKLSSTGLEIRESKDGSTKTLLFKKGNNLEIYRDNLAIFEVKSGGKYVDIGDGRFFRLDEKKYTKEAAKKLEELVDKLVELENNRDVLQKETVNGNSSAMLSKGLEENIKSKVLEKNIKSKVLEKNIKILDLNDKIEKINNEKNKMIDGVVDFRRQIKYDNEGVVYNIYHCSKKECLNIGKLEGGELCFWLKDESKRGGFKQYGHFKGDENLEAGFYLLEKSDVEGEILYDIHDECIIDYNNDNNNPFDNELLSYSNIEDYKNPFDNPYLSEDSLHESYLGDNNSYLPEDGLGEDDIRDDLMNETF